MHKYTEKELINLGYNLRNVQITDADLSMEDHGCLTFDLTLEGAGFGVVYGGYCIGNGCLGASDDYFRGSEKGNEYIMRIMDVVGVSRFSQLTGKYVRVAEKGLGSSVKIIGNILKDQWFDVESFFGNNKKTN